MRHAPTYHAYVQNTIHASQGKHWSTESKWSRKNSTTLESRTRKGDGSTRKGKHYKKYGKQEVAELKDGTPKAVYVKGRAKSHKTQKHYDRLSYPYRPAVNRRNNTLGKAVGEPWEHRFASVQDNKGGGNDVENDETRKAT